MNSRTKLYNPTADGLPAKVWECLRRSADFGEELRRIEQGQKRTFPAEADKNPFACFVSDGVRSHAFKANVVGCTWPETPPPLRSEFIKALTPLPTPFRVKSSRLPGGSSDAWELWAVPRQIRSRQHRGEVLRNLRFMLAGADRTLLGSEMQWATYLRLEQLVASGMVESTAEAWTALETLERKRFESLNGDRVSDTAMAAARWARSRQSREFEARLGAIKQAIASVYPRFKAFALDDTLNQV